MKKLKHLLFMLFQLLSLLFLLSFLSHGGLSLILGEAVVEVAKVIIQFGVILMNIAGIIFGLCLPSQTHRVFRQAQIQTLSYTWLLLLYQAVVFSVGMAATSMHADILTKLPTMVINVIFFSFGMLAIMTPYSYIKRLFNMLKSVEVRDPRSLVRQFFT